MKQKLSCEPGVFPTSWLPMDLREWRQSTLKWPTNNYPDFSPEPQEGAHAEYFLEGQETEAGEAIDL